MIAAAALGIALAAVIRHEERGGAREAAAPEATSLEAASPAADATEPVSVTALATPEPVAATAVAEAAPSPALPPERALPPGDQVELERLRAEIPRALDARTRAELEMRLAGLSRRVQEATLRKGAAEALPQAETPPPPPKPAPYAVRGRVRDALGAPIAEALVIPYASGEKLAQPPLKTSAEGTFTLAHESISDGRTHRVVVEHRRYRPRELGIPPRRPEDEPTPLEVVLEDGPPLSGIVRLPGGAPAEGAVVEVVGIAAETRSDRDGRFELPVLPPGRHAVFARMAERRLAAIAEALVDADGFPVDARPIALDLGAEAEIVASGLETLTPGLQPPRVDLWLGARTPLGTPPFRTLRAGADGVVRYEALPPGAYTVALTPPAIGYLTPEPVAVTLAAGARREVWLGRSGSAVVHLRARGPGGAPERAVFSAWGDLGGSAAVISTTGEARLEGLPADRYFVFCNDQKGGLARGSVRVAAGEVATLDIAIGGHGRAIGALVDEAGQPAVGARVTGDTAEGRITRESVVDAEGRFALEWLYPGRHIVRARLDGRTAERVIEVGPGEVLGPLGLALGALPETPPPAPPVPPAGGTGAGY